MTLIAVSIFVDRADDVSNALGRARAAAKHGAHLIEWRLDLLAHDNGAEAAAKRLVRESPLPCIVTCRPTGEGGRYTGDERARAALLESVLLSDHPPRYVDVELEASEVRPRVGAVLPTARGQEAGLILSSHDHLRRPADLLQKIESMAAAKECSVIKVAWSARSLRDNLEAFDLLRSRPKPMIALCMGRFGLMSRVLAGKFGGLLTFAVDSPEARTAPGQPTINALRSVYRFDSIGPATRVYGVIGWPVEHSLGPQVHNAGFAAVGHDGVYLPLPIPPEFEHLKATLGSMLDDEHLDLAGVSVTLPHKENLVRFLRQRGGQVDVLTELCGAGNTLVVGGDGSLACLNTDAAAAVDVLRDGIGELRGLRIAVLGAGGVARSVAAGLSQAGATVVVFNRTRVRAEAVAAALNGRPTPDGDSARVVVGKTGGLACGCFPVLVNCTSIGMTGGPAPTASPLSSLSDEKVPLNAEVTVFDTVYTPRETPLIREARDAGARVITGAELFVRQAALQFEAWTGKGAPREVFGGNP